MEAVERLNAVRATHTDIMNRGRLRRNEFDSQHLATGQRLSAADLDKACRDMHELKLKNDLRLGVIDGQRARGRRVEHYGVGWCGVPSGSHSLAGFGERRRRTAGTRHLEERATGLLQRRPQMAVFDRTLATSAIHRCWKQRRLRDNWGQDSGRQDTDRHTAGVVLPAIVPTRGLTSSYHPSCQREA